MSEGVCKGREEKISPSTGQWTRGDGQAGKVSGGVLGLTTLVFNKGEGGR